MKTMTFFMLPTCPYCMEANRYIEQVLEEEPELRAVEIRRINEREQADYANSFDYYYVPSFYLGDRKLHEGAVTKEQVRAALRTVYESEEE